MESLPHLAKSLEELECTRSLADQINNTAAFDRANTWVKFAAASTAMCRVSPLHGLSLDRYVRSATTLRDHFKHDCSFLIAACEALIKEGGHMTLRELWRRSNGPPSATSAQKMIDLLMRAPLVAVRVSREDSLDSSWIVTAKSSEVNYARLGGLLSAIEKPATFGTKSIPKSRLAALKRLASTAADRRLVELAAIDQSSARTAEALTGRKNESAADRQRREGLMQVAIETFVAYRELAVQVDTPAELSALLGGDEITDADLRAEIDALKSEEAALEASEEEAMLVESFLPTEAQYDAEDVDKDLEPEANFHEVLAACDEEEVNTLAQRLTNALEASGHSIELDAASLGDKGKQEELVQAFGEGWGDALRLCLSEPVHPAAELPELIDDLDAERPVSLVDDAQAMALSIKLMLGVEATDFDEGDEGSTATAAELTLLSDLTPKQLITKMLARNLRWRERQAAKSSEVEAARRSLAGDRGRAACLETVLGKWPDVGDKIEAICADLGVGADAKRRDGAMTINSAVKASKGGIGFTRIRLELEQRHGIVLSARGLRDLCFARDRRMLDSKRYKGVVNLVYRRSVKRIGQDNVDDHSQNSVYRMLHHLRDRCEFESTLWFQRDDHAKIRGGSSESTRGASVTATGEGAAGLQHDYMNPELSSPLYATSVLVSGCGDGGRERCLAFVKAERLAPSTPSQHYADFYMAQERARDDPELRTIFFTHEGKVKPKVQLEVDGGADEDPTKRETRFLQTELLMGGPSLDNEQRRAQAGTNTREAAGTPKNKVERLNGEMTAAAANFHAIPSDEVIGSLRDDATGQYDKDQLNAMWAQHAEDYRAVLDRKCQLNGSTLQAYAGATPASCDAAKVLLERRPIMLLWLDPTTSKKKRAELEHSHPVLVAHFKMVLATQEHTETLMRYSSCASCCASTACKLCHDAPRVNLWYAGGPALKPPPPAMHDPDRPGHYLPPEAALMKYASDNYKISTADRMAPSEKARAIYERVMDMSTLHFPEDKFSAAVTEINDSRITLSVLRTHFTKLRYIRLRVLEGRRKAAVTRAKNKAARQGVAVQGAAASKAMRKGAAERRAAAPTTMGAPAGSLEVAEENAAAEKAAAKKVAKQKAGAAEEAEEVSEPELLESDADEPVAEPPTNKWLGHKIEVQACNPDVCDYMCGECAWDPCEVNTPGTQTTLSLCCLLSSYSLLSSVTPLALYFSSPLVCRARSLPMMVAANATLSLMTARSATESSIASCECH